MANTDSTLAHAAETSSNISMDYIEGVAALLRLIRNQVNDDDVKHLVDMGEREAERAIHELKGLRTIAVSTYLQ